jgi:hypothetical protein
MFPAILPKRDPINVNTSTRWRLASPREATGRLPGYLDLDIHLFSRFHLNSIDRHKSPRRPFEWLIVDNGTFVLFKEILSIGVTRLSSACIMAAFYAFTPV